MVIQAAFGFLASISLASTLSITDTEGRGAAAYSNSFLSFFLGMLCGSCLVQVAKRLKQQGRWKKAAAFTLSLLFSLALVAGRQLETVENVSVTQIGLWLNVLILSLFFSPFLQFAWQWIEENWGWETACGRRTEEQEEKRTDADRSEEEPIIFFKDKAFWKNLLLLFLCWFPVFLALYPGAFVYDAADEYVQVATRTFTTHHPLIHVLLLGGFVAGGNKFFGSFNLGIAAYTLVQMWIMAGVFSYTLLWIKRRIKKKWVGITGFWFYAFFPVMPMYAVCSAKDGLFTAALLVVVIQMLTFFENPKSFLGKKRNVFASILAAAAMMLLRNNGQYAYYVWIPLALLALPRFSRRKAAVLMLASVALFMVSAKGLAWGLKADAGGSQEMLTVPIQQLARTWKYSPKTYKEEEKQQLFSYLPQEELQAYNPRLSDIVKSKFNNEVFRENKAEFIQLWLTIGLRKPMSYLNAWLMTSYGFWYPDAVINVYGGNSVYTFTYEDSSYFGFETEAPGVRESKFPWLEEQYRRLSLELYQQKVPGVSMLFSPGFLFWIFAFCLGFLLWKREWARLVPLLLILLVWLTFLLGPTYLVRYALILWFALPVIVSRLKVCYTYTITRE